MNNINRQRMPYMAAITISTLALSSSPLAASYWNIFTKQRCATIGASITTLLAGKRATGSWTAGCLFGIGAGAIAWYYYSKRDTADASISYPDSTEPLRGQPAEEPLGSVQQEIPKQSLLKKRKRKQKQKRVPTIQELIRLKLKELAKAIQELNSIRENYATNEVTKSTIAIVEDQRDAKLKQKKQLEQRLQALQRVTSP